MERTKYAAEFKQHLLSISLAYFHGLSRKDVRTITETHMKHADEELIDERNNHSYWVPLFPTRNSHF
jgi:hypothetical protein